MEKILNIHIKNNKPVDINNLARSLNGLANLYKSYVEDNDYNLDIEPKLYVKEIKEGSIDIYLLGQAITLLDSVKPTVDFANHLFELLEIFKGSKDGTGKKITKKDCDSIIEFTDVTARDVDAKVEVSVKDNAGAIYNNCSFVYTTTEANAAQNGAKNKIDSFLAKKPTEYSRVAMYWADANFISSKSHGKIIIEEIDEKSKGVLFLNDEDRKKCTSSHVDYPQVPWQKLLYIVDVKGLYVNNKLQGYEIIKVYNEVLPLEE